MMAGSANRQIYDPTQPRAGSLVVLLGGVLADGLLEFLKVLSQQIKRGLEDAVDLGGSDPGDLVGRALDALNIVFHLIGHDDLLWVNGALCCAGKWRNASGGTRL